jgi:hypothetical protein
MAVFIAKIANLIGWGEVTTRRGDGWARNKFKLKLGGHPVTIVQRARVLEMSVNAARGKLIESSTVRVAGIKTYAEGLELVEDLCALLSFARHTRIAAYEYRFGNRRTDHSIVAACNQFRPPFSGGVAKLSDFVTQTWPAYRAQKQPRALGGLIHMITLTDADGTVLETKVTKVAVLFFSRLAVIGLADHLAQGLAVRSAGLFRLGHVDCRQLVFCEPFLRHRVDGPYLGEACDRAI